MALEDIMENKLTKIILALLFFLFIYKIIYNILIFFSVNKSILQMYMAWIAVFILLITILPQKRYNIIKNYTL